uniref:Putative effector protein n=1 Tax=Heterodera avenae TaxID=34510 RepID=A0A2L0VDG7_HETAV|nr:putative effector protein [Heterodera avenae]
MRYIVLLIFSVYFFALFRYALPDLQQQNQFRVVRLADVRCCYKTPNRYVCASVLEHVRHGCKKVAQIWAEGQKDEADGRIVSPGDLPPSFSAIGLPCFRDATRVEQEAQPPPIVVAERYACLNIKCLCTFFGGVSSACYNDSSTATEAVPRALRQSGTPNLSLGRAVRMEYRMLSENQRARFHTVLQQLKRGIGSNEYDRLYNLAMMPSVHGFIFCCGTVKRCEIALCAVDPSVAVPYGDSSKDGRLTNPATRPSRSWMIARVSIIVVSLHYLFNMRIADNVPNAVNQPEEDPQDDVDDEEQNEAARVRELEAVVREQEETIFELEAVVHEQEGRVVELERGTALQHSCFAFTMQVAKQSDIDESQKKAVLEKCEAVSEWIKSHPNAAEAAVREQQQSLNEICNRILEPFRQETSKSENN